MNKIIKKLNTLAEEQAATTLNKRLELVIKNTKNLTMDEKELKSLCNFIFEPLSKETKHKYYGLVLSILKKEKSIEELKKAFNKNNTKTELPKIIKQFLTFIKNTDIIKDKELKKMFLKCFPDALENALHKASDGTYYLITGDIPAMWFRDSALQIHCYLPFVKYDQKLKEIFKGIIIREAKSIIKDPYAYAFYENYEIRRKKYELDSLLYFVWILYELWKETNDSIFNNIKNALNKILETMEVEQKHNELSNYKQLEHFSPNDKTRKLLTKPNPVKYTGMIWNAFRPSDDPCYYNYHIPSEIFALKVLDYMNEIYTYIKDKEKAKEAFNLKQSIEKGINEYAIIKHENYSKIFAYEVDGFGHYLLMDDANLPSLLSIPYFNPGYKKDIYKNTRKFILSKDNPYFIEGKYAKGIGSPHRKGIWTLSLIMQAITGKEDEAEEILNYLKATHAGTYLMHEAFNPNNPKEYTRPWFSMGNSMFAELLIRRFDLINRFEEEFLIKNKQ